MIIEISEFPHKAKLMECCNECKSLKKKNCEVNPMVCKNFYNNNYEFIIEKAGDQ